jgi:Bacterial Ig-like domain (group 3)
MFHTLRRSLRAPTGRSAVTVPATFPVRNTRAARRERFIPRLEFLEDRNLLTTITPGVVVVSTAEPALISPESLPFGFSPAKIRQAYGFNQVTFQNGTVAGDGRGETIAIIDAYDQPNIASNLATFDATYGIAAPPSFQKVNEYGGGALPTASASWGVEESLDVEWAHAMAPGANILLVEASSATITDLLNAVNYARNLPGVAAVSMSFGGGEFSSESALDSYFTTPAGHSGVAFIASSGDSGSSGAPEWPSVSANVLAIGGTQLTTDSSGDYYGETAWSGSGGGTSQYETQPAYQHGVVTQTATVRAVPDVAYNASTNSPFAIYDTSSYSGWIGVAGTSCGAPQWSALVAIADQGRALQGKSTLDSSTQLLPMIYGMAATDFHDIITGNNGGYSAQQGYDLVTGRGTPLVVSVVAALVGPSLAPAKTTFTALASSANPTVYGMSVTLAARVFAPGSSTPVGTVAFMDGSVMLGEGTLTGGVAAFSTAALPTGGNDIRAIYEGSATDAPSSSLPLSQLVFASPSTVTIAASANPAPAGSPITLTAAVSPFASGGNAPGGTVWFLADGEPLGFATLSGGSATLVTTALNAGDYHVTAVYSGDGNYYGSVSAALLETIDESPAVANGSSAPGANQGSVSAGSSTTVPDSGGSSSPASTDVGSRVLSARDALFADAARMLTVSAPLDATATPAANWFLPTPADSALVNASAPVSGGLSASSSAAGFNKASFADIVSDAAATRGASAPWTSLADSGLANPAVDNG